MANRAAVDARIGRCFRAMTRDAAAGSLRRSGTAYGFVNGLPELAAHPALRRVGVDTPGGPASVVAPSVIHDAVTPALGQVPSISEHSAVIRAEFADAGLGVAC